MKGTLEILVGISGSGKSTYAHEKWKENPKRVTIVNRDKIRELLFGFSEETVGAYYGMEKIGGFEKKVTRYEDTLINEALLHGNHVIVDATHLTRGYIERFKYWNVPTSVKIFEVEPKVAVIRDIGRIRNVGKEVIEKQASRFTNLVKNLTKNPIDFTPVTFDNNPLIDDYNAKTPTVIFDIDNTLAHRGNRSPYDWLSVGKDTVDYPTATMVDFINTNDIVNITICTGRDGICLEETEKWLDDHSIPYDSIYIREVGDMRPDWVVKEEMWRAISKENYILGMFDDRLQVVRRARALGLKVFNVEYANF